MHSNCQALSFKHRWVQILYLFLVLFLKMHLSLAFFIKFFQVAVPVNNKIGSTLGGLAIIAVAFVFLLQFRNPSPTGLSGLGSECVAEIRGQCISLEEFSASYRMIAGNTNDEMSSYLKLKQLIADGLVERWLLNEEAKRLGINVSEDELTKELAEGNVHVSFPIHKLGDTGRFVRLDSNLIKMIPVKNSKTKQFDIKIYERMVRQISQMSPVDFREFQRKELIAAKMRELISSRARISESEAWGRYSREKETSTVNIIRFDERFYADFFVDSSEKAIQNYEKMHQEDINKQWESTKSNDFQECRVTRHILIKADTSTDGNDDTKKEAKDKIEKILDRVKKGADFSALAKEVSEDSSSSEGGLLGCVGKGKMVKPFEDAAFALQENTTSGVVESEFGYHIILVEKIAKKEEAERTAKYFLARKTLIDETSRNLAKDGAKQVQTLIESGKLMDDALKTYLSTLKPNSKKDTLKKDTSAKVITMDIHPNRPAVESSLPFGRSGNPLPGSKSSLAREVFDLEKPGSSLKNSVHFATGEAIVQLKEKQPATREQWEKEREFFKNNLRKKKEEDVLIAYMKRIRSNFATDIKYDLKYLKEKEMKTGKDANAGE